MTSEQAAAGAEKYPIPDAPPVYHHPPDKVLGRRLRIYELISSAFVLIALAMALWLAGALLVNGVTSGVVGVGYLIAFWAALAYLAMPRLNQIFTLIYLPDYFIGRTRTGDGILGDAVNLALDGTEADVHAAMHQAGWTRADELSLRSSWGIVLSSVLRRSYPSAPVSNLFLFDRRQAFAYEQEVAGNPSQRHHVRFWPTPDGWLLPGGHRVDWLAAATYDRAVGFADFTGQITHKVDQDIDIERDYVVDTVRYADTGCGVEVIADFSTAYHSRNGGGDAISTDGDLPVLGVAGAADRHPAPELPTELAANERTLPPLGLLLTAGFVLLLLIAALAELRVGLEAGGIRVAGAIGVAVAWALTVRRLRWAWVALMAVATVSALEPLLQLSTTTDPPLRHLVSAGVAVLVVLAVSSRPVRQWVRRDVAEPTVGG